MAKTRGPGLSGFAVTMIGAGALAIYSAIKGTSPLDELRGLLTGKRPDPLGTGSRGTPLEAFSGGDIPATGTEGSGKARIVGAKPHVAAEANFIANTWGIVADATLVSTGHISGSDHYQGLAIDAMLPSDKVKRQNIGDAIFNHYIQNAKNKHVKYVIWQHTIWSTDRGAHTYPKNDHFNHVHISFYPLIAGRVGR